jgi:tRNA nucleotidyltransferase (CCA-adding enzyme)
MSCTSAPSRSAVPATSRWEHFPHDADIGIRGYGQTVDAAFEQAALALAAVITEEPVRPTATVKIECGAPDRELLLVEWLNALVYEIATRKMLFAAFAVCIDGNTLKAEARGEPIQVALHKPTVEVKGATYTGLHVAQDADGLWRAECVIDV